MNKLLFVVILATFLQPNRLNSMEIVVQKGNTSRRALQTKINELEALFAQNPDADWGDAAGQPYDKATMYALWFCHALANMRNTDFIQAFIKRGVDVNRLLRFEGQRPSIISPLAVAVMARTDQHYLYEGNYLPNIELLLAKGATFCGNAQRVDLAYCISRIYYQFAGADLAQRAVHEKRFLPTLSGLIKLGCSVRGLDGHEPPLQSSMGMPKVTQMLLSYGANPLQVYNGQTMVQRTHEYLNSDDKSTMGRQTRQTLLLLEANAAQRKAAQEYLPALGKDATSRFAKLPAEIRTLVGNYFEW